MKVVLSFKKRNDVIKHAFKGSGGWMGLGVSKLEAKINNTATAGIWGRYEAG